MKEQLKGKQVTLKISSYAEAVVGIVYELEADGLWIQASTNITGLNVKHALVFVPFCQMSWLAVAMTAQQLTGHRA